MEASCQADPGQAWGCQVHKCTLFPGGGSNPQVLSQHCLCLHVGLSLMPTSWGERSPARLPLAGEGHTSSLLPKREHVCRGKAALVIITPS